MNSLRPLITITILAVVGAWLYVKINEGPARPTHGEAEAFHDPTAEGVPPLAATTSAQPADVGEAPKWPTAAETAPPLAASQPAPATLQPAPATAGNSGLPDMPAVPALPNVSTPQSVPPATAANDVPVTPPANIPQARYPDAADAGASITNAISSAPAQGAQINPAGPATATIGSVPIDNPLASVATTEV
jgi:hypothetical protein